MNHIDPMSDSILRQHAIRIFEAAVSAVQPQVLLQNHLTCTDTSIKLGRHTFTWANLGTIYVIGAGKAASGMAVALEKTLAAHLNRIKGVVTTKHGHRLPTQKITIVEAGHPIPDQAGIEAVKQTLALLEAIQPNDIIICLMSGGASALWCDISQGITLQAIQRLSDALIKSGASIQEINTVRKHLATLKGGQLVARCPNVPIFSFIISDVATDDLSVIASGPTVGDASTYQEAFDILVKYQIWSTLDEAIQQHLMQGIKGILSETPLPQDALFIHTHNFIIGNNAKALATAADEATNLGYSTAIASTLITGNTETEAQKMLEYLKNYDGLKPVCFIQGGETTLQVTGKGKGGRNQHFVLKALALLQQVSYRAIRENLVLLSGGTDGSDGPTDATGAIIDANMIVQSEPADIESALQQHDSYHFFKKNKGLLQTGVTQTNVMDVMIALLKA